MQENSKIFLITADLGYGILDKIREDFPARFLNIGSCEQLMIGVAVGLAHNGFVPVCYSISTFLLYRPFEMIRNYMDYEKTPIKLIGSGRDKDYAHDGISHWAEDDTRVVSVFDNITVYKKDEMIDDEIRELLLNQSPVYINLSR